MHIIPQENCDQKKNMTIDNLSKSKKYMIKLAKL